MYALRNMFSWPDSTLDRCLNLILWGCIAYLFYIGYRVGQDAGIGLWGLALPDGALLTFLYGVGAMYLFDNHPMIVSLFLAVAIPFIYYSIARDHPAFGAFALSQVGWVLLCLIWVGLVAAPHYLYAIDQRRRRAIEAYLAQHPTPQAEAAQQTDTKTLAAKILSELPIPQHLHYLLRPSIEYLLEDAASVPGWSFEEVRAIIQKPFADFIQKLESHYKISHRPTLFSVPYQQVLPFLVPLSLTFSSYEKIFLRRYKYSNIRYSNWEREKNREPRNAEEQIERWLAGSPMGAIYYNSLPFELPHQ